ncbi:MAG: M23 family metallopeptidase [Lysobacter sp.]|nr:M23 family metallopeptidase [Lysobacter sp.]
MINKSHALLLAALLTPAAALSQGPDSSGATQQTLSASGTYGHPVPDGCALAGGPVAARPVPAPPPAALLPAQLEVRTPLQPTAFPSGDRHYLIYELHLRNFGGEPLELQGLEVMGEDGTEQPIAAFGEEQLASLLFPRGHQMSAEEADDSRQLDAGQGAVAYLCLAFERGVAVPALLRHRVLLRDAYADGPSIRTGHTRLRTLAPPVEGPDWIAAGGPGNTSHHRAELLVIGGNARISRRYAIDWRQVRDGATFAGDALEARAYHAYGEPVFAVAEGTVVSARDGLPDNVPRTPKGFDTAVAITMETIAGNAVTLDLGGGEYALYAHMAPGSVQVKPGDHVKRGQVLGRIGNSGDSREPHLHFEVTDSPDLLAGEGLPYLFDRYGIRLPEGRLDRRANELPMLEMLIDFRPTEEVSR